MEYAGFKAAAPIDWAKLTSGLTTTIQGIGEKREVERQELDKLQTENAKILDNTELGKSQSFNELLLGGAGNGKENLVLWNKQLKSGIIKPLEYRNKVNNLMSNWSTLAKTAKSFDQQMQETIKLQQEGKGSGFSLFTNGLISEIGDLKSKKIQIDPNTGNVLIGRLDDKGMFDPNSIVDVRTLSQPGNMIDYKLDLTGAVDVGTKNIKSWVEEKGITTVTDPRKNPAVKQAMFDLAKSIASNPRAITSVLVDNTSKQYDFYYKEQDLKNKLDERANYRNEFLKSDGKSPMTASEREAYINEQKKLFIPVVLDANGTFQPNPTPEQQDEALKTVSNTIETRLEYKKELDEPQSSGGGGGGRSDNDSKEKPDNVAITAKRVYNAIRNSGNDPVGSANELSKASGGKYVFKNEPDGLNVYEKGDRDELVKVNTVPFKGSGIADDLYGFFTTEGNQEKWKASLKKIRQGGGGSGSGGGEGDNIFN